MNILMSYGADFLVILASLGAMAYCMVLSRRLSRLSSFDKGLGGAIAVMSAQVDEMKAALKEAKAGSDGAGSQLHDLVIQAREISSELEMMIAACHDFAEEAISVQVSEREVAGPPDRQADLPTASPAPALVPAPEPVAEPVPEPVAEVAVAEVTAMFGSRRATPVAADPPPTAKVEPLFGRHKSAAR